MANEKFFEREFCWIKSRCLPSYHVVYVNLFLRQAILPRCWQGVYLFDKLLLFNAPKHEDVAIFSHIKLCYSPPHSQIYIFK